MFQNLFGSPQRCFCTPVLFVREIAREVFLTAAKGNAPSLKRSEFVSEASYVFTAAIKVELHIRCNFGRFD